MTNLQKDIAPFACNRRICNTCATYSYFYMDGDRTAFFRQQSLDVPSMQKYSYRECYQPPTCLLDSRNISGVFFLDWPAAIRTDLSPPSTHRWKSKQNAVTGWAITLIVNEILMSELQPGIISVKNRSRHQPWAPGVCWDCGICFFSKSFKPIRDIISDSSIGRITTISEHYSVNDEWSMHWCMLTKTTAFIHLQTTSTSSHLARLKYWYKMKIGDTWFVPGVRHDRVVHTVYAKAPLLGRTNNSLTLLEVVCAT